MRQIETVSLIGLGAIGAAYGTKLHKHLGENFTVVANEERVARYEKHGIQVLDETIHFHYETPNNKSEYRDLVIFATKNAELKEAIEEIKPHIGPDTIILSLLNGISSEEEIFEATKSENILYSMCVGMDIVREKQKIQFTNMGKICFGARDKHNQTNERAVQALFDAADVPYEIPEDIWYTIWAKFMFNVGINQMSALLRATYGYFQNVPELHTYMEEAMYEVLAISEKIGVGLKEEDILAYRPILHTLSPDGMTSMMQDMEGKRKTEVEYFAGKVVELGEKHGVPTPINAQLLRLIPIVEAMNEYDKA